MSWLDRIAEAIGWGAVRLVPTARRDWAEALWAEAHEVPTGWPRLAWQVGGVLLIAREAQMVRRIGLLLVFVAAAGAAAWAAWPQSAVPLSHGAAAQGGVIVTMVLLAGLPLLSRWLLGPPGSRVARWLRAAGYAAILAIVPAKAVVALFVGTVPRSGIDRHTFDVANFGHPVPGSVSGGPPWSGEMLILLLTASYLATMLTLTARRASVAPATLAVGARAGLVLGLVASAAVLAGPGQTGPGLWLPGFVGYPLVALTFVLLFSTPFAAGALAARRYPVPADTRWAPEARLAQGAAAGLVSGGVGALVVTVFGTGTIALMVRSALVREWLYHGHLTASAVYGRELYASQSETTYVAICIVFPVIGLVLGLIGAGRASAPGRLPDSTPQKVSV
jgi:hypothetical protein